MKTLTQTSDSLTSNLDYALSYAARGWHVFPVHSIHDGLCTCGRKCNSPGKHPILSQTKSATTDEGKIRKYWTQRPNANIGILTGKISNLIVLDIDPRNGGDDSLVELTAAVPKLSEHLVTLSCKTGGNGAHYYFKWNSIQKTKHNVFDGGIDIQSDGAYVIAPPSLHASGGAYIWNYTGPVLPYPAYLLTNQGNHSTDTRWECRIPEGTRNTTLASLAGSLFQKGLKYSQVCTRLLEENAMRCDPPLPEEEIRQIVHSIKQYSGNDKKSFKTEWQEKIVRSNEFNPQEIRTLIALSLHMDVNGRGCFPSQELLAEETHSQRPTINRHIKKAEKLEWLETYTRPTGNGRSWSKGYIATLPNN